MNNNNLTCFMYSFPIPVDFVDPASGILLQAKEGGVKIEGTEKVPWTRLLNIEQ
jgi:hypothetical protein